MSSITFPTFFIGLFLGLSGVLVAEQSADYVFTNARIYTGNPDQAWARAVAVADGKFVYVGNDEGAKALVGDTTKSVDLAGKVVLPGLIESHIHLLSGAATTSGVPLAPEDSLDEVIAKIRHYTKEHPEKEVVFGAPFNQAVLDETGTPRQRLDAIAPDRPVLLLDQTLRAAWVNSKTLEKAGITRESEAPAGGRYERNEAGELTGILTGSAAYGPVMKTIEAIPASKLRESVQPLLEGLSELGFTTCIDMGMPFAEELAYQQLVDLDEAGKLPLRISLAYLVSRPSQAGDAIEKMTTLAEQIRSPNVWIEHLKILGDGVIENQKAAMLEPYEASDERGALHFSPEQMDALTLGAANAGYHVVVHAIGDRAIRHALDAAERLRKAGFDDTRFSVTHGQLVDPEDRDRFADLGVFVQTTGHWAMHQEPYYHLLGEERYDTLQLPLRTWLDTEATVALGADWPAVVGGFEKGVNPFMNIYSAMHREAPSNLNQTAAPVDVALPPRDEIMTLEEAIHGYTMAGARMLGIADVTGSIEVGKRADLILLNQDIFEVWVTEIPKTEVLMTMFQGEVVHDVVHGLGDDQRVDLSRIGVGAVGPCSRHLVKPGEKHPDGE